MPTTKRKTDFFISEEGIEAKRMLLQIVADDAYDTGSSYTANSVAYPDNQMPFINKHMDYLSSHPAIDAGHYISNLRLRTRIKTTL